MSSMIPHSNPRLAYRFGQLVLGAALALSWSSPAHACGGFFCSASSPVNQAAERIIFARSGETTTQIVEILYEGPSERFAWVLPVPGTPDIAVSSSLVFQRLQQATNPTYTLNDSQPGCGSGLVAGRGQGSSTNFIAEEDLGGPMVTVVDQGSVGPFDYQTISVDPADEDPAEVAVRWLESNDYDVDALGGDVLRPYLEAGMNLLAVRLQKGLPTGAIRPLSLTFQSAEISIPIRPTAVAANDDMGVLVWVLGETRAVPTNYKGLVLNELLIDWTNPGNTYDQVVSAAADEAGGQGFVTELAERAQRFHDVVDPGFDALDPNDYASGDVGTIVQALAGRYAGYDGFDKVLAENVVLRDGVTIEDFVRCPGCYFNPRAAGDPAFGDDYDAEEDPIADTNVSVLMDAIVDQVLDPISDAADLFEQHEYVTRLYTTMSAEDMDTDPVFDFNPDLQNVSNQHVAERLLTCDGVAGRWRVTLADGRRVYGEGFNWPLSPAQAVSVPANAQVLAFKTSGAPDVETDNAEEISRTFSELPASKSNGVGGSCSVSPRRGFAARSAAWLALAAAFAAVRRRRRR